MIVRIVKLTFRSDTVEKFQDMFRQNQAAIASFDGCEKLDLLRDISDPRVFFTYSLWQTEMHLEKYRNSELFNRVWAHTKQWFAAKPEAWSLVKNTMPDLDISSAAYWESRYVVKDTGWDVKAITTPLKTYIDQLNDKNLRILIPGAGNGYEAEYLFLQGFENVYVMDIAPQPLRNLAERVPEFPPHHLLLEDFFLHAGDYDLIIEQTFFCAIPPSMRPAYAEQMHKLLSKRKGKLVGLLFNDVLNTDKPPFGGNKEEYASLFQSYFHFEIFDTAYNSIPPRTGRELFIKLKVK
jgi:methyl halide transferase